MFTWYAPGGTGPTSTFPSFPRTTVLFREGSLPLLQCKLILIITSANDSFQIRSNSEVLGVRPSTYEWGGRQI